MFINQMVPSIGIQNYQSQMMVKDRNSLNKKLINEDTEDKNTHEALSQA